MKGILVLIGIAAAMISFGCDSTHVETVSERQIKIDQVIVGRVLDVHLLGKIEEKVTVCHFDPRYVIVIRTESGVKNLAIHSPAMTFMGADPMGKSYRFLLSKSDGHFLLEKAEEINLQPASSS